MKIQGMHMRLRANMFQGQAQEFTDAQVHTHTPGASPKLSTHTLLGQAPAFTDSAYKKETNHLFTTHF
jgi:hypothetical protein